MTQQTDWLALRGRVRDLSADAGDMCLPDLATALRRIADEIGAAIEISTVERAKTDPPPPPTPISQSTATFKAIDGFEKQIDAYASRKDQRNEVARKFVSNARAILNDKRNPDRVHLAQQKLAAAQRVVGMEDA